VVRLVTLRPKIRVAPIVGFQDVYVQIPIAHEVLGGSMSRAVRVSGLGLVRIDTAREAGRVLRIAPPPPLSSSSSPLPGPASTPSPSGEPPRGP
jgi:hypothetical protein